MFWQFVGFLKEGPGANASNAFLLKGGESFSQFRWFTVAKSEL